MKIILSSSISTYHLMVRRRNHPPNKACFANSWKWTWTTWAASKYAFNYSNAFQQHEHFWIEFSDVLYQSEQSAHRPGLPVQQGQPDQAADVHQGPICDTDHEAGKNYGDVVCWKHRRKSQSLSRLWFHFRHWCFGSPYFSVEKLVALKDGWNKKVLDGSQKICVGFRLGRELCHDLWRY